MVAVKHLKDKISKADIEKEAAMINSFDHPGTKTCCYIVVE